MSDTPKTIDQNIEYILTLQRDNARLRIALEALLSVRNDIEVLGEWEEADINRGLRRTVRAKVDAVVAQARAALRGEG